MKIQMNIRPTKITARTKSELVSKVQGFGGMTLLTVGGGKGSSYNGYVDSKAGVIYLFNATKFRHKSQDTAKGRVRVQDAHWEGYVYRVPLSIVHSARQNSRNFTLTVKVPA